MNRKVILAAVLCLFAVALAYISWVSDAQAMLIAFVLVLLAMAPFFVRFERKSLQAREIVLVACLAAIAAIGRVPFAFLPGVQPTSFVVIVAAIVFGGETGFMVGALAALVSNLFLGQGPWTPWQMFSWGMIGLTAGWLQQVGLFKHRLALLGFGLIWGFLFGWIMDIWVLAGMAETLTWYSALAIFAASFYFDLSHAICNVVFLLLLGSGWIRILQRYKRKYGLLN
jgi:energy-coupling factor transport system substrate-specific component